MALQPTLTAAVDAELTTGTSTDATIYGGTNPNRIDFGVFVSHRKINASGEAEILITAPNKANPILVNSWTFPYGDDGRYSRLYIAVPNYTVGTYALNDCVHSSGVVYQSQTNGNSNPNLLDTSAWLPVLEPGLLVVADNAPANCTKANLEIVFNRRTNTYLSTFALNAALDCDCSNIETHHNLYTMYLYNEGMVIANDRAQYAEGEKLAVKARKLYQICINNGL